MRKKLQKVPFINFFETPVYTSSSFCPKAYLSCAVSKTFCDTVYNLHMQNTFSLHYLQVLIKQFCEKYIFILPDVKYDFYTKKRPNLICYELAWCHVSGIFVKVHLLIGCIRKYWTQLIFHSVCPN